MTTNDLCFVGRLRGVFQMRVLEGRGDYFEVRKIGTVTGKANRHSSWMNVHVSRVFPIQDRLNSLVDRVNQMDEYDARKAKSE